MSIVRCALKARARAFFLGMGLSLALVSCGPKAPEPTPAPPAVGDAATVTPAGESTAAPGSPAPATGGPAAGGDAPIVDLPVPPGAPVVRQAREHWAEVDLSSLPKRARKILKARSPSGYLELQSSQGVKKVEIGEILSLGLEADLSFLLGGPVKVDGQTMEITYVVTLDDEKREHIDTIILDEASSRVPYKWSEEKGAWVGGAPLPNRPQ